MIYDVLPYKSRDIAVMASMHDCFLLSTNDTFNLGYNLRTGSGPTGLSQTVSEL